MAGLGITFDLGRKRREQEEARRQRQLIAAQMFDNLAGSGYQPEEINAFAKSFIEKGDFSLPTTRETRAQGPATREGYLPTVQEPIRFRKKQGGLWVQDSEGKWTFQGAPEGVESVSVARRDQSNSLVDILDDEGNVVGQTKKGAVRLPKKGGGGSGRDATQEDAAKATLAQYDQAAKSGDVIPEELRRRAVAAAEFLGLPTDEIVTQPAEEGFLGFGKKDEVKTRVPSFGKGSSSGEGQVKVINGVTYKKGSDGKWHKQ